MTAHYLSHSTYPIKSGDIALIHAAAGGVGLLLVQMAKKLAHASLPPPVRKRRLSSRAAPALMK